MVGGPVLLLEDDPMIRDLLEAILSDEGHVVRSFCSREQLVSAAREAPGALALVDFWGTSHQVLSDDERREVVALARAVPTVLVTGRTWARHETAEGLGCVAVIEKPFDVDEVVGVVSSWVAEVGAMSAAARDRARRLRSESRDALQHLRLARHAVDDALSR